jgi:hypothetical protein
MQPLINLRRSWNSSASQSSLGIILDMGTFLREGSRAPETGGLPNLGKTSRPPRARRIALALQQEFRLRILLRHPR